MRLFKHEDGTEISFNDNASEEVIKQKLSWKKGAWTEIPAEESTESIKYRTWDEGGE